MDYSKTYRETKRERVKEVKILSPTLRPYLRMHGMVRRAWSEVDSCTVPPRAFLLGYDLIYIICVMLSVFHYYIWFVLFPCFIYLSQS